MKSATNSKRRRFAARFVETASQNPSASGSPSVFRLQQGRKLGFRIAASRFGLALVRTAQFLRRPGLRGVRRVLQELSDVCDALGVATPCVAGTHRRWASPSAASRGEGMGAGRLIPLQRNIKEPDWRPMASETTNPPS